MPSRSSRAPRRVFTLVELIVVIAIIAVLASMLLPALTKARAHARRIACLSQQRQIFTAAIVYADDYDELVPATPSAQGTWWRNSTNRYAGPVSLFQDEYLPADRGMMLCPARYDRRTGNFVKARRWVTDSYSSYLWRASATYNHRLYAPNWYLAVYSVRPSSLDPRHGMLYDMVSIEPLTDWDFLRQSNHMTSNRVDGGNLIKADGSGEWLAYSAANWGSTLNTELRPQTLGTFMNAYGDDTTFRNSSYFFTNSGGTQPTGAKRGTLTMYNF